MKKYKIAFIFLFAAFVSCSSDHEEDLIDNDPLTGLVTYKDHVKPIIDNNCLNCHSSPPINGASVPLVNYDFVKSAVENNALIQRIKSQEPGFAMPFSGPMLPQNLIDLVEQWEVDGLLED